MNKVNYDYLIDVLDQKQRDIIVLKNIIEKCEIYCRDNDLNFNMFIGTDFELNIKGKPGDLTKIRKMLKYVFGSWNDKLSYISNFVNIWAHYNPTDKDLKKLLEIIIEYDSEKDLPKSITKNGKCGFKETLTKTRKWVCDKELQNA